MAVANGMSAVVMGYEYGGKNPTCFNNWFWSVVWLMPDYDIVMLPTLAFETECKLLDDNFEGEYVDYIIPETEEQPGDIIVHKGDRYPLH